MSIPAFGWALARGVEHKLLPSDRLVLIYLADQANGARVCWPGQSMIERYTGLKNNTVRAAVNRLASLQLIRADMTPGKVTRYTVLRPDTPANGLVVTPANGHIAPPQNSAWHPLNGEAGPPQKVPLTPANGHTDPLGTQEVDPKTRVRAQEAEGFQSQNHPSVAPQPEPSPPKAPTIGTTPDGSGNYRPPSACAQFADPADARAVYQAHLAAKRQQDPPEPEDAAADRTAVRRAAAATIYQLRKYATAPGAKPQRSRFDQIEALHKPAPAASIIGEILPPIRRGPLDPVRTVAEQLAALGYPQTAEANA